MEACLYESLADMKVRCNLCYHRCTIKKGKRGLCQVRENRNGVLNTLVYKKIIARHIDPIEKKPLYHLSPGSRSYSVATVGCNFKCRFCQNADIAQMPSDRNGMIVGDHITPQSIADDAVKSGCATIAYTYTEPTVYFELALDISKIAHDQGIRNVFVTNGYMTPEALDLISPYLDAANVDLKAFNDDFYKKMCGARLENVKTTLKQMKAQGVWVEVTTLLIPGLNDNKEDLQQLAAFLADSLGPETPWHISRFHPTYKLQDRPPTPVQTLTAARKIGIQAGLRYVYTGNVLGGSGADTFCWNCGALLINRHGFQITQNRIENGQCAFCHTKIDGLRL
ncbi:AmmeMemoRadiSam system radical SAM enzyme [Desulfococcaceae bacterium HSG9]|nr:AmmeMemoRadiSam system radical SAM enzyme [Desulfococcaceae bacterium HSG9]